MDTMEQKYDNPLGYEPIGRLLRQFAVPAVISMVVNALYNIVDQIFIGQGVGYLGNAATTIAFPIVTIVLAISTTLGAGGSSFAAIKLGEGRESEADHTLGNVFILLLISGIVVTVLGLIFLEPLLRVFGATAKTMGYAKDYTSIILLGVPFNMLGVGLSNMARTDGSPSLSMYSILVGAILNTILDPIYIFVFHWGVKGAAVATITSQIISAIVLFYYFAKKGKHMRLRKATMKLKGHICKRAIALGISSGVTQIASTLLQVVMNNSLIYYGNKTSYGGDMALSAMGIVMKLTMIIISICIGIGIGSQPILGFNRGANQPHRIRKTYLTAVSIATLVTTAGWIVFMTVPGLVLKLFGTADAMFTQFAIICLRTYMAGVFCAGFQIISTSYFQATGQPMKATVLSMMRQIIILIPLLLILPRIFGLDGILYAGPIADIGSGLIVLLFIIHEMKRVNRWIDEVDTSTEKVVSLEKNI